MAGKNTAVFGIFRSTQALKNGVDALKAAGFRNTDISVLFPENVGTKDFAHKKETKAPEGTATGATAGALIGGGLGWLAGIGALAIPRPWALHRRRTNHGGSGWRGSRWRGGRHHRSSRRHGHS